jgi:hypothetical protein
MPQNIDQWIAWYLKDWQVNIMLTFFFILTVAVLLLFWKAQYFFDENKHILDKIERDNGENEEMKWE